MTSNSILLLFMLFKNVVDVSFSNDSGYLLGVVPSCKYEMYNSDKMNKCMWKVTYSCLLCDLWTCISAWLSSRGTDHLVYAVWVWWWGGWERGSRATKHIATRRLSLLHHLSLALKRKSSILDLYTSTDSFITYYWHTHRTKKLLSLC